MPDAETNLLRPERIGVVGGGTMGVGIVYVFAMAGLAVSMVEPDDTRAEAAHRVLFETVDDGVRRGKLVEADALRAVHGVRRLRAAHELPEQLDLVIETTPERLEIKRTALAQIASRAPALIATNTSALSIDLLAQSVSDPASFLGMHFFNPVWSLPIVEIVRGAATNEAALGQARRFADAIGKTTITVSDTPGFATSRLDLIAAMEAIRMLEGGVASAADIDKAMVVAYRHPIGPLRLSDIVGLDVRLDIARHLSRTLGERYTPPRLLEQMVDRGELGRKSGKGFFEWPSAAAS